MSESMCACPLGDPLQVVFPVTLPVGIVLLQEMGWLLQNLLEG